MDIKRTERPSAINVITIERGATMFVERLTADISLPHKPRTGNQAYDMLVQMLRAEIQEKESILAILKAEKVREKFIEDWNPNTRSVDIYNI